MPGAGRGRSGEVSSGVWMVKGGSWWRLWIAGCPDVQSNGDFIAMHPALSGNCGLVEMKIPECLRLQSDAAFDQLGVGREERVEVHFECRVHHPIRAEAGLVAGVALHAGIAGELRI